MPGVFKSCSLFREVRSVVQAILSWECLEYFGFCPRSHVGVALRPGGRRLLIGRGQTCLSPKTWQEFTSLLLMT